MDDADLDAYFWASGVCCYGIARDGGFALDEFFTFGVVEGPSTCLESIFF